jgi:HSP20 family molecular chaperone IbpA
MFWEQDVFEEMQKMQKEMEILFQKAFADEASRPLLGYNNSSKFSGKMISKDNMLWRTPKTYLAETENSLIASFELPEVDKKDIELNISSTKIELKVEKTGKKRPKRWNI